MSQAVGSWRAVLRSTALPPAVGLLLGAAPFPHIGAQNDIWLPVGPQGGSVTSIVIPAPGVLYAGTALSGVFKSTDAGQTWRTAREGLVANARLVSVVASPAGASPAVYAGTLDGVWASTDGGTSWSARSSGLTNRDVRALLPDPRAPATLVAGTHGGGVFRSTNAGVTWTGASSGLTNPFVRCLAFDAVKAATVYAGTAGGIFRSTDGGQSWTAASTGLGTLEVRQLAVDPATQDVLYAATFGSGVFKSTNAGGTWTPASSGLSNLVATALLSDPTNAQVLYVTTYGGLFRSGDAGATWSTLDTGGAPVLAQALALDPAAPRSVYAGTDGAGILRSQDAGDSWAPSNTGLVATSVSSLALSADAGILVAAVPGSGVHRSTDRGLTWSTSTPDRSLRLVKAVAMDPTDPNIVYAGTLGSGVFQSLTGGASWAAINDGLSSPVVQALAVDPEDPSRLFAATEGGGVFRSTDRGASWSLGAGSLQTVLALLIDPGDHTTLLAGTATGVLRSTNGGASWSPGGTGLGAQAVYSLLADPAEPDTYYAGTAQGAYVSMDRAQTWAPYASGLSHGYIPALAADPPPRRTLYAGTDFGGVLLKATPTTDWADSSTGLGDPRVTALAAGGQSPVVFLAAGTLGGGVFVRTSTGPPPSSLSGTVYLDANDDGSRQAGETGIPGVTVSLTGADDLGPVNLSATTIPDGSYSFVNLRPGTYALGETQPAGYIDGRDRAGTLGGTVANDEVTGIVLAGGSAGTGYEFGELRLADLRLSKSVSTPSAAAGATLVYALTVMNAGPTAATSVALADAIPAGTTFQSLVAPPGWTCVTPPVGGVGLVSCTTPSLALGASAIATLSCKLDTGLPSGALVVNTAALGGTQLDPDATNNTASATTRIAPAGAADLVLSSTSTPPLVAAGQSILTSLLLTNNGPASAAQVRLVATLPSASTFNAVNVSQGFTCQTPAVGATGVVDCSVATLAAGTTATLTIEHKVKDGTAAGAVLTMTGAASSSTPDPVPPNNASSSSATVAAAGTSDLAITKSVSRAAVAPGQSLLYTLTVTNRGPAAATGLEVTDPLPAAIGFASVSAPTGWTCTTPNLDASGTVRCTAASLPAGGTASFTLLVRVAPSAASGTVLANTASIAATSADPTGTNNQASATSTVRPAGSADLTLSKVDLEDPVLVASTLAYSLMVTNAGPADATGVTLTDTLPAALTLRSATPTQGSCSSSGGTITCALGALAAGNRATVSLVATPGPGAAPSVTNTATATAVEPDPDTKANSASETTTVTPTATLAITKIGPANVVAGAPLSYTLTVTNAGPSEATTVTLSDPTPVGLTFQGATAPCATGFPCSLGSIPAGQSRSTVATYFVPVGYKAPNPIVNVATVSSPTDSGSPRQATVSTPLAVTPSNLAVTKTGPMSVSLGGTITYTLTVRNVGNGEASDIVLDDPTPPGLVRQSVSAPCSTGFPCSLGTLQPGQASTVSATYLVPASYAGPNPILNTASASSPTDPASPKSATAVTAFGPPLADLSLQIADSPDPIQRGGTLTYTNSLTNAGPWPATNAVLTQPLPGGLTFLSVSAPVGFTCTTPAVGSPGTVFCTAASMPFGSATLTLAAKAASNLPDGALLTATATVASATPDPALANNADQESTRVSAATSADISVAGTVSPEVVATGGTLTYAVTLKGTGPAPARDVRFVQTLPAGATLQNVTPPSGWTCTPGSSLTCMIGSFTGSAELTLVAKVDGSVASGAALPSTLTISAATADPDPTNDSGTLTASAASPAAADLSVSQTDGPDPILPGQRLTYTLRVRNLGPGPASGVQLTDTLPPGMAFVSATAPQGFSCSAPPAGASGTLTCLAPSLASGAVSDLTLLVDAPTGQPAGALLTNGLNVLAATPDPRLTNNSAAEVTTLNGADGTDLAVAMAVSSPTAVVGTGLTYTITVTNLGPRLAQGVTLQDSIPSALQVLGAASSQGSCTGNGPVSCVLGDLPAGAFATVSLLAKTVAAGTVTNSARSQMVTVDGNPNTGFASATTLVSDPADLTVRMAASPPAVIIGQDLTFTVSVSNQGPGPASRFAVVDVLPPGAAFVSAPSACAHAGGVVTCRSAAPLASGQTATFAIVTRSTVRDLLQATATVIGAEDLQPLNDSYTLYVVSTPVELTRFTAE